MANRAKQASEFLDALAGTLGIAGRQLDDVVAAAGLDVRKLSQMDLQDAAKVVHEARTKAMFGTPTTFYGPATPTDRAIKAQPVLSEPPKITLDERTARPDSYVRQRAMENLERLSPELAARVRAGDPEAMYEAVRSGGPAPKRGRPKTTEESIRELAKPADQAAAENIAQQFDEQARTPNAMIPYGHRGPGVTVGEPYGPELGRLQFDPSWQAMLDEVGPRKLTGPSAPSGSGNGMARRAALAAAAAGAAGGAYMLSRGGSGSSGGDLTDPGNPADLKEDPVSGSPMAFSDETLGGMSPADLVTPVGPAKPSGASAYDPGVERLRRMAEYNAASRAGTLTPQQLAAGSDTRLLTDQINAATQSPDYRFPSNHPSADLRNRARQLPMNSPERDRLNAQAAAIDNEVLAGRRQWDFNPPSAAAADPWADTVGPSPSQSAAPPAAAPSPAAKGSPVAPKPAQYSNNFVDRMDGLTLHQEIQRVLQQVEDINTDPDPNRRWTQDEWDYAKELIAEHNARAHVGIRGYEPMHNPFLDSDRREADLTEAGNPAELAATPVAAPQMAGRAQAPAGPAAPGRNGIPLPQVVTSGRSAPTGPTTVPTMTLGLDKADAAATPITPDADLKPNAPPASPADLSRMLPGETMDEYKARVAQVMGAETQGIRDRTAARSKAGYKDAERQAVDAEYATPPLSPRNNAAGEWRSDNGGPPRLYGEGVPTWARGAFGAGQATIDGVTVPTYDLGDGQMRYRLRDVKAAQEAEAEARRVAGVRNIVNSENERYGHYSITANDDPRLTDAQRAARDQRAAGKARAKEQRARIRKAQIDNANRPLTPFEKKDQERRQRYSDMARLAGGSQNINAGNRAFFNALATLEGVAPEQMDSRQRVMAQMMPMDPVRAQVEARQLDQAARLAGDAITGALAGQGQMDQAGALRREQRMQNLRAVAGQAYRSAYRSGRREAVDAALIGEGASLQERQAILADLFPGGQEPAPDDASEGQYFPGQTPAPPPGEPLAAPRPFG